LSSLKCILLSVATANTQFSVVGILDVMKLQIYKLTARYSIGHFLSRLSFILFVFLLRYSLRLIFSLTFCLPILHGIRMSITPILQKLRGNTHISRKLVLASYSTTEHNIAQHNTTQHNITQHSTI